MAVTSRLPLALVLAHAVAALALSIAAPASRAAGLATNPSGVATLPASAWTDPTRGVVIVATAATRQCSITATAMQVFDWDTRKQVQEAPVVPIDMLDKSDFEGHYGSLSALSLPPGHYAMRLGAAGSTMESNGLHLAFEVRAGTVIYLGRVRKFGDCNDFTHHFDVVDRFDIDVPEAALVATDPKAVAAAHRQLMEFE